MGIIRIQRYAIFISAIILLLGTVQAFGQTDSQLSAPQEDNPYAYSHDLKDQTITFQAVNEQTEMVGVMTVTLTGKFGGNRLWQGPFAGGSQVGGKQQATFSFVPSDSSQPSYSARIMKWQLEGKSQGTSVFLDFIIKAQGSDGSSQRFFLREVVNVTEYGAEVTFAQLKLPKSWNTQEDLSCGTIADEGAVPPKP